jgi:hypothetical protein
MEFSQMTKVNRDDNMMHWRVSALIKDPIVRAAFQRAERDYGQAFAIPDDPPNELDGGAAEPVGERVLETAS